MIRRGSVKARDIFAILEVSCALLCVLLLTRTVTAAGEPSAADLVSMQAVVRADWEAQEKRLGRLPHSPEAIESALRRTQALLADLQHREIPELSADTAELQRLAEKVRESGSLAEAQRRELYDTVRTLCRALALKNPLVTSRPILFMTRHRAVGYMLYEYLGWYYAYGYDPTNGAKDPRFKTPPTGGGVFVLEAPGRTMRTRELTAGQLPAGHFVTLALSFDARTIYFAFADPSGTDPYTLSHYQQAPAEPGVKYNTFHIYAVDSDGQEPSATDRRSERRFRSLSTPGRRYCF